MLHPGPTFRSNPSPNSLNSHSPAFSPAPSPTQMQSYHYPREFAPTEEEYGLPARPVSQPEASSKRLSAGETRQHRSRSGNFRNQFASMNLEEEENEDEDEEPLPVHAPRPTSATTAATSTDSTPSPLRLSTGHSPNLFAALANPSPDYRSSYAFSSSSSLRGLSSQAHSCI